MLPNCAACGTRLFLRVAYRALAGALLACEDPDRVAHSQQALDDASAVARETGALAELPFIERAGEKPALVG